MLDPEAAKKRSEAFSKYYMSDHITAQIALIQNMTDTAIKANGEYLPKPAKFLRINRWLMIMFIYINGQRRQAPELLLDVHILHQQRASLDAFEQIQLDRNALRGDDLAQYTIGDMDLSDKLGKTGIVELWVPYTVAEAIVNFMYLKKCIFGPPSGKSYFFVDINGKALSQDAMYRHTVVIEMFAVMGIRVTATQNRHGFCTTQRLNDCKGSTGVGNKIDTQEEIYNDRTEEIGIKNKMIANRKILEKEAKARTHLKMDAGRKDFFEKQQLENTALGRKMMLQEAEDKEFDKSKNETRINGGKQKIFPRQRFD
jgi:hypothetical protein